MQAVLSHGTHGIQRAEHLGGVVTGATQRDLHRVGADGTLQFIRRALHRHRSVADDANAVGQLVGLFEILRGEKDGGALLLIQPAHFFPHRRAAHGIEPGGGFVQEQHQGLMHQRTRQIQSARHSSGIRLDSSVDGVADVDQSNEIVDPSQSGCSVQPEQST